MTDASLQQALDRAAEAIAAADGLLITAGAGMGADSGLPTFRGDEGLWAAYPALGRAKMSFGAIANPASFLADPALAWGFYGHRLQLYRQTAPHAGFEILRRIAERMPHGAFVFTSNVDGQFQRAGFAELRVCECHGSIHHLQCAQPCGARIWSADAFVPEVDTDACRLVNRPPACSGCGGLARPNILMFDDWHWQEHRTERQRQRLDAWLCGVRRLVTIELGAGRAIPTVRRFGERMDGTALVRINRWEAAARPPKGIGVPMGALAGLEALAGRLGLAGSTGSGGSC